MSDATCLHATAVALGGKAVLITGASGSGKSSLALELMALGCQLVSDDQTALERTGDAIRASAPAAIRGLIEARGVGLLRAEATEGDVVLVIDLDQVEAERLPPPRTTQILGLRLPCLQKVVSPAFPAAILQYLKAGREPTP